MLEQYLPILLFILVGLLVGPLLWSIDPGDLDVRNKDLRPFYVGLWGGEGQWAWAHPLGSHNLGRDVMANLFRATVQVRHRDHDAEHGRDDAEAGQ